MRKVALVVGVSEYTDRSIDPLRYGAKDAHALAECLRSDCGFDEVRLLADGSADGEPSVGKVVDEMVKFRQKLRSDDLFLLYFAGHAVEDDGDTYLLTRGSRRAAPEMQSLKLKVFLGRLAPLEASRRVVILDACRIPPHRSRGGSANTMGLRTVETLEKFVEKSVERPASRDVGAVPAEGARRADATAEEIERVTAILTACSPLECAYEWDEKEHGVFTYFLLQALREAAWRRDALEFARVVTHVKREVKRWCKNRPDADILQTPKYLVDSELPLELARRGRVQVVEPEPRVGPSIVASVRSHQALLRWGEGAKRRSVFVTKREEVVFGRGSESDFVVRLLPFVSRQENPGLWDQQCDIGREHLRMIVSEDGVVLTPASRSGRTYLVTGRGSRLISDERELPLVKPVRLSVGPADGDAADRIELALRARRDSAGNVAAVVIERHGNGASHRYVVLRSALSLSHPSLGLVGLPKGLQVEPTKAGVALRGTTESAWPIETAEFRAVTPRDFMLA